MTEPTQKELDMARIDLELHDLYERVFSFKTDMDIFWERHLGRPSGIVKMKKEHFLAFMRCAYHRGEMNAGRD